jgi:hypothetical protein
VRSLVRVQDGPPKEQHQERGGLAQLVERLLCKQDVSGSSPLTSTVRDGCAWEFFVLGIDSAPILGIGGMLGEIQSEP